MSRRFLYLISFSLSIIPFLAFFSSCSKEDIELSYQQSYYLDGACWNSIKQSDNGVIVACGNKQTNEGIIALSEDYGNNWSIQYDNFANPLYDIAFLNDTTLYCIGNNLSALISVDRGRNWRIVDLPPQSIQRHINPLSVMLFPDSGFILFAGGEYYDRGLLCLSYDMGNTWKYIANGCEWRCGIALGKNEVLLGGYGRIARYNIENESLQDDNFRGDFIIGMDRFENGQFIAVGSEGGVFACNQGDNHWCKLSNKQFPSKPGDRFNELFVNNKEAILVGPKGLLIRTIDNGNSWKRYEIKGQPDLKSVTCIGNTAYFSATNDGYILKLKF